MHKITTSSEYTVYDSVEELPQDVQTLMQKAIAARKDAYAPYSKFRVGAAVLLDNGETVQGSNQENAAFPSGLCAERVAVFYAAAKFPQAKIIHIAISAASDVNHTSSPTPPCGGCRQALVEYEVRQDSPFALYFMGETGIICKSDSVQNLLPFTFDKNFL